MAHELSGLAMGDAVMLALQMDKGLALVDIIQQLHP